MFVSCSSVTLTIILPCNYYLEAVDPLPASSRDACNAIATRSNQGVSGVFSTENRLTGGHYSPRTTTGITEKARSPSRARNQFNSVDPQISADIEAEKSLPFPRVWHHLSVKYCRATLMDAYPKKIPRPRAFPLAYQTTGCDRPHSKIRCRLGSYRSKL